MEARNQITLSLPSPLRARLQHLAEERGESVGAVIRYACLLYLERAAERALMARVIPIDRTGGEVK